MSEENDAGETIDTVMADAATDVEESPNVEAEEVSTEKVEAEEAVETSESSAEKVQKDPDQSKFDKLTKKRRAAERDAAYWREQAMKNQAPAPEPVKPEPIKTLADFDYDEAAYQQHLFARARNGAVEEAKTVLQREREQEVAARRNQDFNSKLEKFAETVDDFDDVVRSESLRITQAMADAAADMDTCGEVLYHLGKNPELAANIASLSPIGQAREMGRIEAKLELQTKSGKKVSDAPPPAPKIKAGNPAAPKTLDELEGHAYNERRRKYIEANR